MVGGVAQTIGCNLQNRSANHPRSSVRSLEQSLQLFTAFEELNYTCLRYCSIICATPPLFQTIHEQTRHTGSALYKSVVLKHANQEMKGTL